MNQQSNVDLSAFPILRLDQISMIDSRTLESAVHEIDQLLESNENDNPSMNKYLGKQLEQMKYELSSRKALERVNNLLSGLEDPMRSTDYLLEEIRPPAPKKEIKPEPKALVTAPKEPIQSIQFTIQNKLSQSKPPAIKEPVQETKLEATRVNDITPKKESKAIQPNIEPVKISPQNNGLLEDQEQHTPRSTVSSQSSRSRRSHAPPTENPSKKSLEVIYKNFGNEFIVAATEKKKRFYPAKKQPVESIQEIKNRERAERRKLAMQRLLKRKEEQEEQQRIKREKKRLEKAKQKEKEREERRQRSGSAGGSEKDPDNPNNTAIIESSDSESVSGGDDDDHEESNIGKKIEISQNMVDIIKESVQNDSMKVVELEDNEEGNVAGDNNFEQTTDMETVESLPKPPMVAKQKELENKSTNKRKTETISKETIKKSAVQSSVKKPIQAPTRNTEIKQNLANKSIPGQNKNEPEKPRRKSLNEGSFKDSTLESGGIRRSESAKVNLVSKSVEKIIEEENILDLNSEVHSPRVPDTSVTQEEFESKNLAALMMIRKLKEGKKKKLSEESAHPLEEEVSNKDENKTVVCLETDDQESKVKEEKDLKSASVTAIEENIKCESTEFSIKPSSAASKSENEISKIISDDFKEGKQELDEKKESKVLPIKTSTAGRIRSSSDLDDGVEELKQKSEIALFHEENGCFICNYEPEKLPGILAWKLEKVSKGIHEWRVDISNYSLFQPSIQDNPQVFEYRSNKRRNIPLGLILIAQECESLILGQIPFASDEEFIQEWCERIECFDEIVASNFNEEDQKKLFTNHFICGNGYMVCKKIEDLIKDIFSTISVNKSYVDDDDDDDAEKEIDDPLDRGEDGDGDDADDENDQEFIKENQKQNQNRVATVSSRFRTNYKQVSDESDLLIPEEKAVLQILANEKDNHSDSDLKKENDQNEQARALFLQESESEVELEHGEFTNTNVVDVPDNEEIFPLARSHTDSHADIFENDNNNQLNLQQSNGKMPNTTEIRVPKASQPSSGPSSQISQRSSGRNSKSKNEKSFPTLPKSISNAMIAPSSSSSVVKLTDYYPNFGMIFPVAYSQLGARDDDSAARALIETMHLQAKLYDEWIDIMRDYSTVFCADDNDELNHEKDLTTGKSAMDKSADVYHGNPRTLHYRVKSSRSEVTNIITDVFNTELKEWIQLPHGLGLGLSWNLLWTWSKPHINKAHLLIWQKVNHFDDSKQLTRKDLLKKNIQRFTDMKDGNKYANEFEIMPQTFLLPNEYTQFIQSYKEFENMKGITTEGDDKQPSSSSGSSSSSSEIHNYWILKPVGLSRGRGISVIKNLGEVVYSQSSVIQKYIERPLTLNNYKFDLRLFIVVTSFHPLEAFIYRDGFARISSSIYSLTPESLQNKFIHLTNSSIQKQNLQGFTEDNPINSKQDDPDAAGSKISLLGDNGLWKRLEQFSTIAVQQGTYHKIIDAKELWTSICLLVVKSLVMVDEKIVNQPNCFELFGYDVLIDADLRPWLLEVNASPSLARENYLDKRIKNALIKDIIGLLDIAPYDRLALSRVIKKRLSQMSKSRYLNGKNDIELEKDLREILGDDYIPRRYGELPRNLGNFERLCPETNHFQTVMRVKKKIFKSMD